MKYQPLDPWPQEIHLIEREDQVGEALNYLTRFDVLGYDTETYHSVDRSIPAFNPADGAKMRLAQFHTPTGHSYVFDLWKTGGDFLHKLFPNNFLCVIQNAKFELKYLQHQFGIYKFGPIFDTLLAERVIAKGQLKRRADLGSLAKRRLGIHIPKDINHNVWYSEELPRDAMQYAATDASVVLPIWQIQRDMLLAQGQMRVAELEFDTVPALSWMENNGLYLNADKWNAVYEATEQRIDEIRKRLWKLLGRQNTLFEDIPTIKLTSIPQVLKAMQDAGIDVPVDKEGKVSISKNNLKGLLDREEVKLYSEFVGLQKQLSSFGKNWLNHRNPFTGRVHASINQMGAETGRLAASKPAVMQIKKDDLYRNAFEPTEGWVFVDTDYSQCELRILAELCRDPNLLAAFDNDYDLHQYSASLINKCDMKDVTPKQRGIAKNLNFGIVYGIGVEKFATQAEITHEDAKKIMEYYLTGAYPGLGIFLEEQGSQVLRTYEAKTQLGRTRRYDIDWDDKQNIAEVQRNSKNLPVQGGNADITKRAMALIYQAIVERDWQNTICRMNMVIHDELLNEARPDYADDFAHIQETRMLQAEREFLHRVPSKVDTAITKVWCKDPSKEQLEEARQLIRDWGGDGGQPF